MHHIRPVPVGRLRSPKLFNVAILHPACKGLRWRHSCQAPLWWALPFYSFLLITSKAYYHHPQTRITCHVLRQQETPRAAYLNIPIRDLASTERDVNVSSVWLAWDFLHFPLALICFGFFVIFFLFFLDFQLIHFPGFQLDEREKKSKLKRIQGNRRLSFCFKGWLIDIKIARYEWKRRVALSGQELNGGILTITFRIYWLFDSSLFSSTINDNK